MSIPTVRFIGAIAIGLSCLLAGCAGKVEKVSPSQWVTQPAPGKALVYFLRPTTHANLGLAMQRVPVEAPLYDNDVYVASIPTGTHIALQADPGKHLFMVLGEKPDFLKADLLAGKTYHVKIESWFNESRFELLADNGQMARSDLNIWINTTTQIIPNDKARAWAAGNTEKTHKLKAKHLPDWEKRMARDVREAEKHTLRPESGK